MRLEEREIVLELILFSQTQNKFFEKVCSLIISSTQISPSVSYNIIFFITIIIIIVANIIYSFIPQIFIEHQLHARHCLRHQG